MTNVEYWEIICDMCASVHCKTYKYSKERIEKEMDALSHLHYVCQKADEENEHIKQDF